MAADPMTLVTVLSGVSLALNTVAIFTAGVAWGSVKTKVARAELDLREVKRDVTNVATKFTRRLEEETGELTKRLETETKELHLRLDGDVEALDDRIDVEIRAVENRHGQALDHHLRDYHHIGGRSTTER